MEKLAKSSYRPFLVITAPDKPVGRHQVLTPPPVKTAAEKHKIAVLQPQKIENCKLEIENLNPELILVASYGQIIPKSVLDIPRKGCLNVHPSLLPRYRGASPIQTAIANGDEKTGVSIILMDEKMDHGPILAKRELEIPNSKPQVPNPDKSRILDHNRDKSKIKNPKITYKQLHDKLAEMAADLLIETIPGWIKDKIKPEVQDESKAIYTKILKKEDGKIDWKKSAEEIERQIRAFSDWPGTHTKIPNLKSKILKILEAEVLSAGDDKRIGEVFLAENEKLVVRAGQNCLILQKLQLEGKKPVSGKDFLRGHKEIIGSALE